MKGSADLKHVWAADGVQLFHFVQLQEYKLFVQYFIHLIFYMFLFHLQGAKSKSSYESFCYVFSSIIILYGIHFVSYSSITNMWDTVSRTVQLTIVSVAVYHSFINHIVWYAVCHMHFHCCILWAALSHVKNN